MVPSTPLSVQFGPISPKQKLVETEHLEEPACVMLCVCARADGDLALPYLPEKGAPCVNYMILLSEWYTGDMVVLWYRPSLCISITLQHRALAQSSFALYQSVPRRLQKLGYIVPHTLSGAAHGKEYSPK